MPIPFQILTGACNTNGQCVDSGLAHGADILAYGSGSHLFILGSHFERLQIIQDHQKRTVAAVAVSNNGKVFLATDNEIQAYDVSTLKECLEDRICWRQTSVINACDVVRAISCDSDATRLLAASGLYLQLWEIVKAKAFTIGGDEYPQQVTDNNMNSLPALDEWKNLATLQLENPINKVQFSPDGAFFASTCENDPILKVWYKNTKDSEILSNNAPYAFAYLPHPYSVTSFSWRQNASEIFADSVANTLLSVCSDRVCRVWLEMAASPSHHHVHQASQQTSSANASQPLSPGSNALSSSRKISSVVKVNFVENSCVFESFRQFHLVASISPFADLPSPILADYLTSHPQANFCMFWLNNKHMAALQAIEQYSAVGKPRAMKVNRHKSVHQGTNSDALSNGFRIGGVEDEGDDDEDSINETEANVSISVATQPLIKREQSSNSLQPFRAQLRHSARSKPSAMQFQLMRREWIHSPDMVVSFSPADGSFLLWVIDHLDKADGASFVQPTVTFTSCLPSTLPPSDAVSLLPSPLLLYSDPLSHVTLVTVHDNGTLNRWSLSLSEKSKHSTVVNIYHGQRICGHRTAVDVITVHPVLPLVVTHSPGELVFWKITPTTQLHQSGGFAEVTRMMLPSAWHRVGWIPTSFAGNYSPCGVSPSTVFIMRSPTGFTALQVIIDAYTFFSRLKKKAAAGASLSKTEDRLGIVSQQSASRPACVLRLSHLAMENADNCRFFHVFPISAFPMANGYNTLHQRVSDVNGAGNTSEQSEYVALQLLIASNGAVTLQSFHITISTPLSKPGSMEGIAQFSPAEPHSLLHPSASSLSLSTESKMNVIIEPLGSYELTLPYGVSMVKADASISQSPSAFLSNICSPFQIAMGCTDGTVRFWSGIRPSKFEISWSEWKMPCEKQRPDDDEGGESSSLRPAIFSSTPNARIIGVSCAFSCRIAVACGKVNPVLSPSPFAFNSPPVTPSFDGGLSRRSHRPSSAPASSPFICEVIVYECESTGGYTWNVEDTVDLSHETPSSALQEVLASSNSHLDLLASIKIRWSPVHDGSHLLVVLLVDRVYIFAQISTEIASAARASESSVTSTSQQNGSAEARHGLLQHAPLMATSSNGQKGTMASNQRASGVCWVRVRVFELHSVSARSGLSLPTFVSLLQTGLLVVGLGSELQVFSQWQGSSKATSSLPSSSNLPNVEQPEQKQLSNPTVPSVLNISINVSGPTTNGSRRPSLLSPTLPSPTQTSETRSLADNVWLSVSSASFLQMHRTASFQSLAKHTGAEAMPTVAEMSHHSTTGTTSHRQSMIGGSSLNSSQQRQSLTNKPVLQRSNSQDQARAAIRVLEDASLYELALATNPVLPQYHPKFLLELMKMNRIHCVDAILAHVVRSIFPDIRLTTTEETQGDEMDENTAEDVAVDRLTQSSKHFSVTAGDLSASPAKSGETDGSGPINTVFVRPIPLHELWGLISATTSQHNQSQRHQLTSSSASTAEILMSQLSFGSEAGDTLTPSNTVRGRVSSQSSSSGVQPVFTETMARLLSVFLSKSRLPGLSNLDQMYLLALAGLVSARYRQSDPGAKLYSQTLDACGSRFLLDMRHHHYLAQTLPAIHRAKIIQRGLSSASFLWAFHSESQDELLSLIPSVQKGEPQWSELRAYGVGYWLRNITSLKKLGEQLARAAFQKTKDPLDSALYYLALKKKTVLAVLFKSHENQRMRDFFKNDFSEDRWRKAALKNAFDLLAKQRFEHAIAFFLLADSLRDAIEVCVSRLCDLQLAFLIARLHDDSGQTYQNLMKTEILGSSGNKRRSQDVFLLSLAHWVVGEHHQALSVLLDSSRGSNSEDFGHMTAIFGFYCHLKGHPLMRKLTAGRSDDEEDDSLLSAHLERRTHFLTAHSYLKAGCPVLALNVLARMPPLACSSHENSNGLQRSSTAASKSETPAAPTISISKADDLDWSQPVSGGDKDELVLDWGDDEDKSDEEVESTPEPKVTPASTQRFVVTPVVDDSKPQMSKGNSVESRKSDHANIACPSSPEFATNAVAEQLKFICCLRLLADELTALCGGQTSSQLHQQLFNWLQNEFHLVSNMVLDNSLVPRNSNKGLQLPLMLNESGVDVHQLLENLTERRNWLSKNSHLLHCLLNFTSLLAPTSTPLSLALNELCQLSQDLFAPRSALTCKLPTTTSLPLVLAALSPLRACFQNVVSILFNLASDILLYLSSLDRIWPPTPRTLSKLRAVRDLALTLSSSVYQSLCGCDLDPGRLRVVTTEPTKWPGVSQWSAMLQQFADPDCPKLYLLLTRCLVAVHSGIFVYALATADARALFRLIANPLNLSAWNRVFGGAKRMPVRHHAPSQPTPVPQQATVVQQPGTGPASAEISVVGSPATTGDKHRAAINRRVLEQQRRPSDADKIVYTEEFIAPTTTLASYFLRKPEPFLNLDFETNQLINADDTAEDIEAEPDDLDNTEHVDPNSRSWMLMRIALIEHVANIYRQFLPSLGVEHQDLVHLFPLIHALMSAMHRWSAAAQIDLQSIGPPPPSPEFVPDRTVLTEPVGSSPAINGQPTKPFDKYACLVKPDNTPFSFDASSLLHRRLWVFLVRQDPLKPLFIRHVFGPTTASTPPLVSSLNASALPGSASQMSLKPSDSTSDAHNLESSLSKSTLIGSSKSGVSELAVKMIHKDQEAVGAFCINQNNLNCVALALSKEILQLDIGVMLHPPTWVESDLDYDIETMMNPQPGDACNLFTVVSTKHGINSPSLGSTSSSMAHLPAVASMPVLPPSAPGVIPAAINQTGASAITAYGANVLKNLQTPFQVLDRSRRLVKQLCKNNVAHAKYMSSHPSQPFFLVGCQNKTISCWQWGHWSAVVNYELEPRITSNLTALKWSDYGNKFGVAESNGTMRLCLSHVGKTNRPFWAQREAHSTSLSDFCFLDSASVLATVGSSSDNTNLRLWDTLLPPNSQVVQSYICHDGGCNTVAFSKRYNVLLTAGKKGEVALFDLRKSEPLCLLPAHEQSSIKTIAIDPMEKCFATGASDGDVKIWSLGSDIHLLAHLPAEHKVRGLASGFVGSQTVGVTQLVIDPEHRLYSCGADGSFRVRSLTSLLTS